MFYTLQKVSEDEKIRVQPIICTHSLSMIDRAPARIINQIIHEDGISNIDYLRGEEDTEIKEFLDKVSEISGIKNSSIFFERCFLLVEGPTEYNALPIMYKKMAGRSLSEDGVVLINIEGNGNWKSFLKLLNKNKSNATILFLDMDTQNSSTKNNLTKERLKQIDFNETFLSNNVIFIGDKEFEDVFTDDLICGCLNKFWHKNEGSVWTCEDIKSLRTSRKFSDALKELVNKYKKDNNANYDYLRKPEFGKRIGETITKDEIEEITAISILLEKIKDIIT